MDAGVGLSLEGLSVAPAASLAAAVAPVGRSLGLRAAVAVSAAREESLAPGAVRWRRWPSLQLGPQARISGESLTAGVGAHGAVALMRIDGRGFQENHRHARVVFGVGPDLHLGLRRAGVRPWLGAEALFFLTPVTAFEQPAGRTFALPRLQLMLTAGIGFAAGS